MRHVSLHNDAAFTDIESQVISGGAVGLAIARQLAARDGTSTLLIVRKGGVGMETSSRNSEVYQRALHIIRKLLQGGIGHSRRTLLRRRLPQNEALHLRAADDVRPQPKI